MDYKEMRAEFSRLLDRASLSQVAILFRVMRAIIGEEEKA